MLGSDSGHCPRGFFAASVFDADNPDKQRALVCDRLQGDLLGADIPRHDSSVRLFPAIAPFSTPTSD
jgi:hypothetical protein